MNRTEAAIILTYISRTDHRSTGPDDAAAFADLLDDITFADAMPAAREHLRNETVWLTAAHIRKRVNEAHSGRADDKPAQTAEPDADPDDVAAYQAALREGRLDPTVRVVTARPLDELLAGSFGRMPGAGPGAQAMRQAIHREVLAGYANDTARIRDLVMSYPDLRAALTGPPIDHASAEQWGGYIPPLFDHLGRLNSTPRRAVLVAIAAEAERRAGVEAAQPAPQGFVHMPVHRGPVGSPVNVSPKSDER